MKTVYNKILNNRVHNSGCHSGQRRQNDEIRVVAKRLELGVYLQPDKFVPESTYTDSVMFILNCKYRKINIRFKFMGHPFMLEIEIKNIDGEIYAQGHQQSITIANKFPARYWFLDTINGKEVRKRRVRIQNSLKRTDPLQSYMPDNDDQLGKWVVFRITFDLQAGGTLNEMIEKTRGYNLLSDNRLLNVVDKTTLNKYVNYSMLDSDVLYMTECCISFNYLHYYNLNNNFFSLLSQLPIQSALYILGKIYEGKRRIYDPLDHLLSEIKEMELNNITPKKNHVPEFCVMMRKVVVTPTTMYVLPPTMETGNRVIRMFKEQKNNFLRVQFVDEASGKIGSSHGYRNENCNDALYNRIFYTLQHGIKIGEKHYEFLAFSASQLREHSCWFFASTNDLTADDIREWMGDFSDNKSVAKYAARMGQCFSSTRAIKFLHVKDIVKIPDIVNNGTGYTFSDGIGKISFSLARKVTEHLKLRYVPSAFQFRLAGCKGMLSQWPIPDDQVQVRPSQEKFNSDHNVLEIIRWSTFIPSYLNRQAITLLSSLGIRDDVFINLMNERVNELTEMMNNENTAISVLQHYIDEHGVSKSLADLVKAGFLGRKDRYLVNMVELFRISVLRDLKKKAKIRVAKGTFLLGALDETATLRENEIYCCVSDPNNPSSTKVITGTCVVWRNPCFHPGDIRILKAVDCKALSHLVDVIVFPSVGKRDIPNQCSGGDLDGDDFTLIYDERLIPKKEHDPMDYEPQKPEKVDNVQMDHIKKFFVNYVFSDHLGKIANAHLAWADESPEGAFDKKCLRLAKLHSDAVDFPKSGKPAIFSDNLRAKVFPDFMEKPDKEERKSNKVLGTLYRSIDVRDFKICTNSEFDKRLYVEGYEDYLQDARMLKREYDSNIKGLMNQFGIETEFEVTSGYIVNTITKIDKKKPRDIEKSVMEAFMPIKQHFRDEFEKEFYDKVSKKIISPEVYDKMDAKAYAWYYVTYNPSELGDKSMISFPWLIHERLCEIALKNNGIINKNSIKYLKMSQPPSDGLGKMSENIRATTKISTQPITKSYDNIYRNSNNATKFPSNQNNLFNLSNLSNNTEDDIEILKQSIRKSKVSLEKI